MRKFIHNVLEVLMFIAAAVCIGKTEEGEDVNTDNAFINAVLKLDDAVNKTGKKEAETIEDCEKNIRKALSVNHYEDFTPENSSHRLKTHGFETSRTSPSGFNSIYSEKKPKLQKDKQDIHEWIKLILLIIVIVLIFMLILYCMFKYAPVFEIFRS